MNLRNLFILGALIILVPRTAAAQAAQLRPAPSELFRPMSGSASPDTLNLPKTYWKEGAVMGGAIVGVQGARFGYWGCRDTDSGGTGKNCGLSSIGGFVGGFLLGAIPGMLIGGLFEKSP